jgi:pSer/pThr/pTyr-binding forkhead associated (FHA) protein
VFVLEVTTGPSKGQAIALHQGEKVVIGRSDVCQIRLDDPLVSAVHAEVTWTDDGFSIADLVSRNGTLVNGARVRGRVSIRLGDFIQIGPEVLQLKEAAPGMEVTNIDRDPRLDTGLLALDTAPTVMQRKVVPAQPQPTMAAAPILATGKPMRTVMAAPMKGSVSDEQVRAAADLAKIVSGPEAGDAVVIARVGTRLDPFSSTPVTIGREHGSGIHLDDDSVSLRHAVIDLRDGHFQVRDVGSSNGTFVNGMRVVVRRLENGDILSIGRHNMLVVLGPRCLGLEVRAPEVVERARAESSPIAFVDRPLSSADSGKKRPKKKAAELVWFATSDLARGSFRARSAVIALFVGILATGWILSSGDSELLAGGKLMASHESYEFAMMAKGLDRRSCTACHIGVGKVSALKCFDCHSENRPAEYHAQAKLECRSCHTEHRGVSFRASSHAIFGCMSCHGQPHERLARNSPKLVAGFKPDAPAGVEFHLAHHEERGVPCLTCHGEVAASKKGARAACGQCHAPDNLVAGDCEQCHKEHPDRDVEVIAQAGAGETDPPRFHLGSLLWVLGLLVLPFVLAGLLPRRRDHAAEGGK